MSMKSLHCSQQERQRPAPTVEIQAASGVLPDHQHLIFTMTSSLSSMKARTMSVRSAGNRIVMVSAWSDLRAATSSTPSVGTAGAPNAPVGVARIAEEQEFASQCGTSLAPAATPRQLEA